MNAKNRSLQNPGKIFRGIYLNQKWLNLQSALQPSAGRGEIICCRKHWNLGRKRVLFLLFISLSLCKTHQIVKNLKKQICLVHLPGLVMAGMLKRLTYILLCWTYVVQAPFRWDSVNVNSKIQFLYGHLNLICLLNILIFFLDDNRELSSNRYSDWRYASNLPWRLLENTSLCFSRCKNIERTYRFNA